MNLPRLLKNEMALKEWTIADLARDMDVVYQRIQAWLDGEIPRKPEYRTMLEGRYDFVLPLWEGGGGVNAQSYRIPDVEFAHASAIRTHRYMRCADLGIALDYDPR